MESRATGNPTPHSPGRTVAFLDAPTHTGAAMADTTRSTMPASDELVDWILDGARRTVELVADLTDEQMIGPLLPTVNPLLWEIGHLAWFQEKFVLRDACGHDPILSFGDALYDSGAIPHDTRWRLRLPSRQETVDYIRRVA